MTAMRIGIGSIFQESNQFAATQTDLALFRNSYVHEGDALLQLAGTDCEVAGILAVCEEEGAQPLPLLAARSVSGGALTDDCYTELKETLLARLRAALPLDGLILAMHGSMVTASQEDPEGDILDAVRSIVGPDLPIVMTLDLHAHVTPRMVRQATALVSFTHYPHDDTYSTGERGASLLLRTVRGDVRPVTALAKVPIICGACNGQTFGDGPMAHLERRARRLEKEPGILSVSCFQVHPYNDLPGMGCGGVVVTDNDPALAEKAAHALAAAFWERRTAFEVEHFTVAEAVARGRQAEGGPVLLVDTADCAGGGAPGDSVALLRELLALGVDEPAFLMVVDPAAAQACARAGIGETVSLRVGYSLDPNWGQPVPVSGTVRRLSDGSFLYDGGLFGGTWASMGLSAVLQIGSIQLLVMSQPTYDWGDEQFRSVGMDVRRAKFIGVKNPMNYRHAYRDLMKAAFIVDTPGPTPAHVRNLNFERMQRPFFPLDEEIPDLEIPVVVS